MAARKKQAFDLAALDDGKKAAEEGAEVEILHPGTGQPLGIAVTITSYESDRVKKVRRRISNQATKKRGRKFTAEETEVNVRAIVAASVVSWEGVVLNGRALEPTPANIERVLDDYPFITEQIDEAASDLATFFQT